MSYVLKIEAVNAATGPACPPRPCWIRKIDVDAHKGRGQVDVTDDLAKARRFPDPGAAMDYWRRQSRRMPLRPTDGKPNRPGTAYTVSILAEDDDANRENLLQGER